MSADVENAGPRRRADGGRAAKQYQPSQGIASTRQSKFEQDPKNFKLQTRTFLFYE